MERRKREEEAREKARRDAEAFEKAKNEAVRLELLRIEQERLEMARLEAEKQALLDAQAQEETGTPKFNKETGLARNLQVLDEKFVLRGVRNSAYERLFEEGVLGGSTEVDLDGGYEMIG